MFHHFFARFANHRVGQFKKKKEKSIWRTPNVTAQFHPTSPPLPLRLTPSSSADEPPHRAEPFVFDPFPTFSFPVEYQRPPPGSPRWTGRPRKDRWPRISHPGIDGCRHSLWSGDKEEKERGERERRRERNPSRYRCDEKRKVRPREENGRRRVVARGGRGREVRCYPLKSRLWAVG